MSKHAKPILVRFYGGDAFNLLVDDWAEIEDRAEFTVHYAHGRVKRIRDDAMKGHESVVVLESPEVEWHIRQVNGPVAREAWGVRDRIRVSLESHRKWVTDRCFSDDYILELQGAEA